MTMTDLITRDLKDQYTNYLRDVSPMAPSLKTIGLILELATPESHILDLGSGFSSYALRYYAERLDLRVWSVDDDSRWLQRTKEYCMAYGQKANRFWVWDRFIQISSRVVPFDVVFVDIGITKNRPKYYGEVLKRLCDTNTFIVFDDMHKPSLKAAVDKELESYDYLEVGVRDQTLDEFGRFCRLVFRLRHK